MKVIRQKPEINHQIAPHATQITTNFVASLVLYNVILTYLSLFVNRLINFFRKNFTCFYFNLI